MIKCHRYLKSILLQAGFTGFFILSLGLIGVLRGENLIYFMGYTAKWFYIQGTFDLLNCILKPTMSEAVFAQLASISLLVRVCISTVIALISMSHKYKYAVIMDLLITLISIFRFVFFYAIQ